MMKELVRKLIPSFLLNWYHFVLAFLAAFFYRFPSRKMKVIGITGTNGKSTTTDITTRILETAGFKVASLSSIRFKIKDKEWPNNLRMTMPGRFAIQRFLRKAANAGCEYLVLEVTSEGIKQFRHKFINFSVAVFTNLSPEHIEAHKGFENYKKAKGKLFQATKGVHIINLDDENAKYFLEFSAKKKYGYTMGRKKVSVNRNELSIIRCSSFSSDPKGISFKVQNTEFNLKLLGDFNIYNALAAICVGISQDIDLETCRMALEKVKVIPGRMEEVISNPFRVIVDYAFTPNALEKVYQSLQKEKKQGSRLICVLGSSGGGRDTWKRPVIGKIAGKYCDKVFVTNEDPHDEDPKEIIEQVAKGVGQKAHKVLGRREAIREALKVSNPNDIVIITGKGCESWIWMSGGKKLPWDDRKVVRKEFEKLRIDL